MVGIVIVSHSQALAEAVVDFCKVMSSEAKIVAAGGLEDGSTGTSFEKIYNAIDSVYSDDGVIIFMDLGSAVMTAEMVIEAMEGRKIAMADCPLVEGALSAVVSAGAGLSFQDVMDAAVSAKTMKKIS